MGTSLNFGRIDGWVMRTRYLQDILGYLVSLHSKTGVYSTWGPSKMRGGNGDFGSGEPSGFGGSRGSNQNNRRPF